MTETYFKRTIQMVSVINHKWWSSGLYRKLFR